MEKTLSDKNEHKWYQIPGTDQECICPEKSTVNM